MPNLALNINNKEYILEHSESIEIYNKEGYSVVEKNGSTDPLRHGEHLVSKKNDIPPIKIKNLGTSMSVKLQEFSESRFCGIEENISAGEFDNVNIPTRGTREFYIEANNMNEKIEIKIRATWKNKGLSDIYELNNESICDSTLVTGKIKKILESIDGISGIEDGEGMMRKAYEVRDGKDIDLVGFNDGNVIKVALNQDGVKANRKEFQAWQVVKQEPELRKHFCPLIHHGCNFKYVIMEYAQPFKDKQNIQVLEKFKHKIKRNIDDNNVETPVSQGLDIYKENVGKYNGRIVLIDYPYGGKFLQNPESKKHFNSTFEEIREA